MKIDDNQRALLRYLCNSIGSLAVKTLSGHELGSIVTLAMTIDVLLINNIEDSAFLALNTEFSQLPVTDKSLSLLMKSLLKVCTLACEFDKEEADYVVSSLMFFSSPSSLFN